MLFFLKKEHNAEKILDKIRKFLAERGMEISEEKTKVTPVTVGFDFLGWNCRVQKNGKFRSTPSDDNFKVFREKVKTIVNSSNYGAETKVKKLAPIVRGWKNYHKHCGNMNSSRFSLWFMSKTAFRIFLKEKKVNRIRAKELVKTAFGVGKFSFSENKFTKVQGDRSPYDGDVVYWSERNSNLYDGISAKLLKKQNHKCSYCGLKFDGGERVHLHHIDGNHDNWKTKNLIVIHHSCHQYVHMA